MTSFISTIIHHYVICFFGALVRYLLDFFTSKVPKDGKKMSFKEYHNYDEKPDIEMLDAIVGSIFCGILLIFIIGIIRRSGW